MVHEGSGARQFGQQFLPQSGQTASNGCRGHELCSYLRHYRRQSATRALPKRSCPGNLTRGWRERVKMPDRRASFSSAVTAAGRNGVSGSFSGLVWRRKKRNHLPQSGRRFTKDSKRTRARKGGKVATDGQQQPYIFFRDIRSSTCGKSTARG